MTLRELFARHAAEWRSQGLHYAMFGHDGSAHPELPFFDNHLSLADYFSRGADQSVLISNETLSCFTPEFTRAIASGLAGVNTRVLFYIRPYRDWVLSSYKFDVRTGCNGRDFDRYLTDLEPQISVWPMLEIWGETLGWDHVRVRSLHPADLVGGDLITDCTAALDVPPPPGPHVRINAGPGWMATELLRLTITADCSLGWDHSGQAVAEALHELHNAAVAATGTAEVPATYTTPAQADLLAGWYNADLDALARRSGTRLQPDPGSLSGPRAFLPSAAHVPKVVLRQIRAMGLAPEFARLHPEAAEFLTSAAYTTLCGGH